MTWGAFKHENVTQFARPVFLDDFEPANAPPAASTLGLFEISFFELITFRVLLSNSICSPSVENYKNLWYFVDVTVIKTFSRASPRSWKMEIFSPPKMAILVFGKKTLRTEVRFLSENVWRWAVRMEFRSGGGKMSFHNRQSSEICFQGMLLKLVMMMNCHGECSCLGASEHRWLYRFELLR